MNERRFVDTTTFRAVSRSYSASAYYARKLSEHLGLAASTISHHMAALRDAGLVTARKDGTWVYYTVQRDVLRAVGAAIEGL